MNMNFGKEILCTFPYKYVDIIKKYCENNSIDIVNISYGKDVEMTMEISYEKIEKYKMFLSNLFSNTLTEKEYKEIKEKYILVDNILDV